MRFAAWTNSNKTKQQQPTTKTKKKPREKLNAHATAADTIEIEKSGQHATSWRVGVDDTERDRKRKENEKKNGGYAFSPKDIVVEKKSVLRFDTLIQYSSKCSFIAMDFSGFQFVP